MMAAKSSKKSAKPKPSGGFGAKPAAAVATKKPAAPAFDSATALRLSEQLYDELDEQAACDSEALHFREYIVTARVKGGQVSPVLSDWVPVAQFGLLSSVNNPMEQMLPLTHGLAQMCREVTVAATSAVPSLLLRIPHAHLEYAVEPTDR
jgi:hypothetical protein